MKTLSLNALIIDSDPAYTAHIIPVTKPLFNKVFLAGKTDEVMKEVEENKPNVIFLNLTIQQRQNALDLLDRLKSGHGEAIIFGYTDSAEPDLITHALEAGLQDIFTRPFDRDLISTKINRFYQTEKTLSNEIRYTPLSSPIKARVEMSLKLIGVDENGMTLKGDHYISKGTMITIPEKLAKELFELNSVELMVTKTWVSEDWKNYFLYAEPKDSKESMSASLRKFIMRKL